MASELAALRAAEGKTLATPRAVARFLCGVTSPGFTRAKLTGHALFGSLAEVPFARVMAWAGVSLDRADIATATRSA